MFVHCVLKFWTIFICNPVTLCLLAIALGLVILRTLRYNLLLPPGPWGMPFVGSFFYVMYVLKRPLHLYYRDLTKEHGPVMSLKIGFQNIVVLNNYKVIRDAFRKEEFTGRPSTEFTKILGGYGIVNTEGKLWKDQRRFLHQLLRHFGMTLTGPRKTDMEDRIMIEVNDLLKNLHELKDEPIDLNPFLAVSISNVICKVLMSIRFSHNDDRFRRFMHLIDEGFELFGSLQTTAFFPFLKKLGFKNQTLKKLEKNRDEMGQFFQDTIDEHRRTFDPSNLRDVMDAYLQEIEKAKEEGNLENLFEGRDPDRQMQQVMGDMFSAGMETIKTSLQWAVLFMLHYPNAMKAVQEELDEVVGRGRLPNLEDLPYLPVTESTIFEVLRISSIVPMGTTHAPTRDTYIEGHFIPKNVQVVPLLHSVHMDPTLWDEPEKFHPARFIDSEGKVHKPEYFLPFGVGRRICSGAILARMEFFLFFSSLLHSFDIQVPEGETLPSLTGNVGITITPNNFRVSLKARPLETATAVNFRPAGSH